MQAFHSNKRDAFFRQKQHYFHYEVTIFQRHGSGLTAYLNQAAGRIPGGNVWLEGMGMWSFVTLFFPLWNDSTNIFPGWGITERPLLPKNRDGSWVFVKLPAKTCMSIVSRKLVQRWFAAHKMEMSNLWIITKAVQFSHWQTLGRNLSSKQDRTISNISMTQFSTPCTRMANIQCQVDDVPLLNCIRR